MNNSKTQAALAYFHEGYSCAQSVFTAFHEDMKLSEAQALKLSSSFGGGVGGLREVCGAFLGMSMVLGALKGYATKDDQAAKEQHYALIQRIADRFKADYGTLICRDLLEQNGITPSPVPAKRTKEYYAERPCSKYVEACARYAEEELAK